MNTLLRLKRKTATQSCIVSHFHLLPFPFLLKDDIYRPCDEEISTNTADTL